MTLLRHVNVTGDVVLDHHIYAGERLLPTQERGRGVEIKQELGGAAIVAELLRQAAPPTGGWSVALAHDWVQDAAYATWAPQQHDPDDKPDSPKRTWRVREMMGYATLDLDPSRKKTRNYEVPPPCSLLIIDDAGLRFRHEEEPVRRFVERSLIQGGHILIKMARRAGDEGPERLWRYLTQYKKDHHKKDHSDTPLVGLISAADLGRDPPGVSEGMSWEATIDDLRATTRFQRAADQLLSVCDHLIITLTTDAAILVSKGTHSARICLDTVRLEGDWGSRIAGDVIGYHAAMTTVIAMAMMKFIQREDGRDLKCHLSHALPAGLAAMRALRTLGHGPCPQKDWKSGFQYEAVAKDITRLIDKDEKEKQPFRSFEIEWPTTGRSTARQEWSLLTTQERKRPVLPLGRQHPPMLHLARQIVRYGLRAIAHLPHAKLSKQVIADRSVIETMRFVRSKMLAYRDGKDAEKPLSIGVFGPPGAGKSHGVKDLAEDVFGKEAWLSFNLSQFEGADELNGAFHTVRDQVLAGRTPVVFWDEFDSNDLYWLRYLLAPMQDGKFQDGELQHSIGKCVFIFAGGTASSYEEFKAPGEPQSRIAADIMDRYRNRKAPDFVSRLDAHIDVLGPNQRQSGNRWTTRWNDQLDELYPVRRAMMIRHHLKIDANDIASFDPPLLDALLTIDQYRNGARSLEKIMESLRGTRDPKLPTHAVTVLRANLPRHAQLNMHVNATAFMTLMNAPADVPDCPFNWDEINRMAIRLHEDWYDREAKRLQPCKKTPRLSRNFHELAPAYQHANRAAVTRMARNLALVNLQLVRKADIGRYQAFADATEYQRHIAPNGNPDGSADPLDPQLERLSEAEHDGWVEQRITTGWHFDPNRDEDGGRHPGLCPYEQLPEYYKRNDRCNILSYWTLCEMTDWRIARR